MLTLVNIEDKDDSAIVILKYISKVIFVQEIITDKQSYKIVLTELSEVDLLICESEVYWFIVRVGLSQFSNSKEGRVFVFLEKTPLEKYYAIILCLNY